MYFRVLGPLQAEKRERPVDLGGPKQRTLMAALLVHEGKPVSTDRLTDLLWGDHPPATASKTLQKYVSQLRKEVSDILVTHPGGYAIELGDDQVDANRFEALLVSAGRETRPAERAELLEQALGMWRGDPYPELADPTGMAERTRLSELRLLAVEDLIEARLDLGQHERLVGELEALVSEHPLRERLWGQLMVALYRSGRQSEALRAYQRLRRILGEELGIEPSPEIQDMEDRILTHDPGLSAANVPRGRTNLSPSLTSFIGRTTDLREVSELLVSARLVTLVGPAGSGKTRLAMEVARNQIDHFPDGVWFVDLARLTSPDQVADAIATPLGVGGQAERSTEAVLKDYLPGRRLLLLVDNCEHLVTKVGTLITELLRIDPDLTVLATSREHLGVPGEVIFDLPPLPYPAEAEDVERFDAVRLLLDRAKAADPHFRLTPDNTSSVAEICRRLDGMPLAVELAAARVRSFPPGELVRHLSERFEILTSPLRTAPSRHQSLQAAVDWSYQLLRPDEQILFCRLSVFRGGFTFASAQQVCGFDPLDPDQVTRILPELVDRSLVAVDQSSATHTRYKLLETLREYGRDIMDAEEATTLRDSHAAFFCDLSEEEASKMRGPEQPDAIRRLSAEHDNLRSALRWASTHHPETAVRLAIALASFWDAVGPRAEGHEWLQRAVALSASLSSELRIGARLAACELFSSANAAKSFVSAEEALAEARQSGDESGEAKALRALSYALTLSEKPEEAMIQGRHALQIFERLGDTWETGLCLERLGEAEYPQPEQAIADLNRSLILYRKVQDRDRESCVLRKLANFTSVGLGDHETAVQYAEKAVAICEEIGNLNNRAHALLDHGKILRRLGDANRAVEVLEAAFEQLSKSGDERCSVRTLTALGTAHLDRSDEEAALEAFRSSLRRGASLDERHTSRVAIAGMARILISEGRLADAVTLYGLADRLQRDLGVPVTVSSEKRREERLQTLRDQMGDEEFEVARQRGEALELDHAVAFALGESVQI